MKSSNRPPNAPRHQTCDSRASTTSFEGAQRASPADKKRRRERRGWEAKQKPYRSYGGENLRCSPRPSHRVCTKFSFSFLPAPDLDDRVFEGEGDSFPC
jgi:hypothetical protein